MPGLADFLECVDQGVLTVGLERKVEVGRVTVGRVTKSPGTPFVLFAKMKRGGSRDYRGAQRQGRRRQREQRACGNP